MYMKLCAGLLVLLCLGCATVKGIPLDSRQEMLELISVLREGDAQSLSAVLQCPFLLDTEIITIKEELSDFWVKFGVMAFPAGEEVDINLSLLTKDAYTSWGESMDIEQFFQKYIPKGSFLASLSRQERSVLLIVKFNRGKPPLLAGFKGAGL